MIILETFKQTTEAQFSVLNLSNKIPPFKSLPYHIKTTKF